VLPDDTLSISPNIHNFPHFFSLSHFSDNISPFSQLIIFSKKPTHKV